MRPLSKPDPGSIGDRGLRPARKLLGRNDGRRIRCLVSEPDTGRRIDELHGFGGWLAPEDGILTDDFNTAPMAYGPKTGRQPRSQGLCRSDERNDEA